VQSAASQDVIPPFTETFLIRIGDESVEPNHQVGRQAPGDFDLIGEVSEGYLYFARGGKGSELVRRIGQGFSNSSPISFGSIECGREFLDAVGVWVETQKDMSSSDSLRTHAALNSGLELLGLLFILISQVNGSTNGPHLRSADSPLSRLRRLSFRHRDR
jgi:hypothetical protein